MDHSNPHSPRKGRGSISNRSGRYENQKCHAINDEWIRDEDAQPPNTLLREDTSRTIIVRNTSPDIPFDRSINPYRGCEHGCVYCFARPTHAYLGLSPGLDFETHLDPTKSSRTWSLFGNVSNIGAIWPTTNHIFRYFGVTSILWYMG